MTALPSGFLSEHPCVERTLDVEIGNGKTVRIWFDGRSLSWMASASLSLATQLKEWQDADIQTILDWVCKLSGVNAAQVTQTIDGVRIGVMAYLVEFTEDERIQQVISDYLLKKRP